MRRERQQNFLFKTHGGFRVGAGRKQVLPGKPRVAHRLRELTNARFPVNVTVRMRPGIARLRNYELCAVLRRAFVYGCKKEKFRICQFSIQGNHIHLVCEAVDNQALASGMKGWAVRVARGLNAKTGRSGSVFEDRYHFVVIKTPKQCRAALCYVLQNARRHGLRLDPAFNGMDPFSSAWWFDGWKNNGWREGLKPPDMRTVAEPTTWMLRVGWRQHGLIGVDEIPPAAGLE